MASYDTQDRSGILQVEEASAPNVPVLTATGDGGEHILRSLQRAQASRIIALSEFDTLALALTSLGSLGTIVVDENQTLGAETVTVPVGVSIFSSGGILTLGSSTVLTISGLVRYNAQLFDNSAGGSVTIENQDIKPEWFGTVGDNVTNDNSTTNGPLQQAVNSIGTGSRLVITKQHVITIPIYVNSGNHIIGRSKTARIRSSVAVSSWSSPVIMLGNIGSGDAHTEWEAGQTVAVGDRRWLDDGGTERNYTCIAGGGTTVDAPTGTGTTVGTNCTWLYHGARWVYRNSAFGSGISYTLDAVAVGDSSVTLSTAAEAGNFTAGDVVGIWDNDLTTEAQHADLAFSNPTTYTSPRYNEQNVVVSADAGTGVVTLRRPIYWAYGTPVIKNMNGDDVDTDGNGMTSKAVRDVVIENIDLVSLTRICRFGGSVDCVFRNCYLESDAIVAWNVTANVLFDDCRMQFDDFGLEFAYGCHDDTISNCNIVDRPGATGYHTCVTFAATSRNCVMEHSTIISSTASRLRLFWAGGHSLNCGVRDSYLVGPTCTIAPVTIGGRTSPNAGGPTECFCTGCVIIGGSAYSIEINDDPPLSKRHIVTGNITSGSSSTGLRVFANVQDCDFRGNRFHLDPVLGDPAAGPANLWDVDSGTGPLQHDGTDVTVTNDLIVENDATIENDLTVENDLAVTGIVDVGENTKQSALRVEGRAAITTGSFTSSNTLTSGAAEELFKVQVPDGSAVNLFVFLSVFHGNTADRNLSAARLLLLTAQSDDTSGNIVSASAFLGTGPDAEGAEYTTFTLSTDTVDDAAGNLVTLRVTQTNDLGDDLRCSFLIISLGSLGVSSTSFDPGRILRPILARVAVTQENQTLSSTAEITGP